MSNPYALVESGGIVNVVLWDGNAETWSPPTGQQAIHIPDGSNAAIGWTWNGASFEPPA